MTTDELDKAVHAECLSKGAYPSPLLYQGYPKSICTSVNNVVCHGIPDDRRLLDGDIICVDITVRIFFFLFSYNLWPWVIPTSVIFRNGQRCLQHGQSRRSYLH